AATGQKVILLDTDHLWNNLNAADDIRATRTWVWKAFTRGMNPIYMDPRPSLTGDSRWYVYGWNEAQGEDVRWAMGRTRSYADRMNLGASQPRNDLASTGYWLAHPGHEYLVYQPAGVGQDFSVRLAPGTYAYEWYRTDTGETTASGTFTSD